MSYIMRGYKVSVRGAGCFYPYIQKTPFKPDTFNVSRNIPKVYVCREPEKMLCKEIRVTEKDLKRYEEVKVEEGELFPFVYGQGRRILFSHRIIWDVLSFLFFGLD